MDFLLENTFIGGNKSETDREVDKTNICMIIDSSFMYNTVGSLRGPIRIFQGYKHHHQGRYLLDRISVM